MTTPGSFPAAPGPAVAPATAALSPALMGGVILGTLVHHMLALPGAAAVARACVVLYLAVEGSRLPTQGFFMAGAFTVLSLIALPFAAAPLAAVARGLDTAALFAGFTAAVGFLRGAANSSALVGRCGRHLLAQPPGRRYGALAFGAHLYGLILSFGAVELLGAMVKRANTPDSAGGDETVRRIRERRMLMAVYRGFATTTHYSPLTVMLAVVLAQLPMLTWREVVPQGLASAMVLTALGWAIDRASAARRASRAGPRPGSPDRWTVHLPVFLLVAAIFVLGAGIESLLGVSMVAGMMAAVPLVSAAWLMGQAEGEAPGGRLLAAGRRMVGHARGIFPAQRMEVLVLGGAGFAGALVAAAHPERLVAALAGGVALPAVLVAMAVPWLIVALCQCALNPILVVTLVGAVMGDPRALGLDPRVVALAYTGGWCMATSSSPYVAVAVIMARLGGVSAFRVSALWNLPYTLAGLALVSAFVLGLHLVLGAPAP